MAKEYLDAFDQNRRINRYVYVCNNPINFIDPLGLYNEDVHNNLTALLASAVGFKSEDARMIAEADWGIDTNRATGAMPWQGGESARRDFHFTTEGRREDMYQQAVRDKNLSEFGQYLHAEQDSFSHQKGQTDRVKGQEYDPKWGHAEDKGAPDVTANRPELANKMARETYNKMNEFAKEIDYKTETKVNFEKIADYVDRWDRARTEVAKDHLESLIRKEIEQEKHRQELNKLNVPDKEKEFEGKPKEGPKVEVGDKTKDTHDR